jgi:tRNA pseudouridine38-40 synthase
VLLLLEYDGASFHGWQRQAGFPSVQEAVERAFESATGERPVVHGAGRTDAGVHALGQCAHARTSTRLSDEVLLRALNAYLPPSVVVRDVRTAAADFHARFCARRKRYAYRVVLRPVRPALARGRTLWLREGPDLDRMRRAARMLLGRHDFRAFAAADLAPRDTVRTLSSIHVRRTREGLLFVLEADGFLPRMVRSIVGTLLEVGRGALSPEDVDRTLRSKDRSGVGATAPAEGLYLLRVKYAAGSAPPTPPPSPPSPP